MGIASVPMDLDGSVLLVFEQIGDLCGCPRSKLTHFHVQITVLY